MIIVSGALLTLIITLISKAEAIPSFFYPIAFWIVLLIPLVSSQACFLFFDQELVIHAIGSHIDKSLYPRIKGLIENPVDWNFFDFWNFKDLNISTRAVHHTLYHTRWILFLVPTYASTSGIILHSIIYCRWWDSYLPNDYKYWIIIGIAGLIWLFNIY